MDTEKLYEIKDEYANRASDFAEEYKREVEDIRDTVVGTVKEQTGKMKDDKILELRGKLQKAQADNGVPTRVIASIGLVALVTFLIGFLIRRD